MVNIRKMNVPYVAPVKILSNLRSTPICSTPRKISTGNSETAASIRILVISVFILVILPKSVVFLHGGNSSLVQFLRVLCILECFGLCTQQLVFLFELRFL